MTTELAFVMLNADSLLSKTDELGVLVRHKHLDMTGVTEAWLHEDIRDEEKCLPGHIFKIVLS